MSRGLDREEWERASESPPASRMSSSQGRSSGTSGVEEDRSEFAGEPSSFSIPQLRAKADEAAVDQPTLSEFIDRLEKVGVHVIPSIQSDGRLNGFLYEMNGVRVKSSLLGRAYTPKGLQEKKHISYVRERDAEKLQRALVERVQPSRSGASSYSLAEQSRSVSDRWKVRPIRPREGATESQQALMAEVGRFRTLAGNDLASVLYNGDYDALQRDISQLAGNGLIERQTISVEHRQPALSVIALTRKGKALLQRHRNSGAPGDRETLYAGIVKPREVAHDSALYRMYRAEAAQIERAGGSIRRVVLDYELKKQVFSPLAKEKDLPAMPYARRQQEIAEQAGLKVIEGRIVLPDLRIEYENSHGEISKVDLELATQNYRGAHLRPKAQAGFKIYVEHGNAGAPVFDDHDLMGEIFSF